MARRSKHWRVAWTGIVAASTVLGVIATARFEAQTAAAQSQPASTADRQPRFESVMVSKNTSGTPPIGGTSLHKDGYVEASKVTLRQLIQTAYQRHPLDRRRIEGGPAWIDSELFNVTAKAAAEHVVDRDGQHLQTWLMLQTLLAEYFNLKLRTEIRRVPIYALVLAKNDGSLGPQLRRSDVDCAEAATLMIQGRRPKANCGFQQFVGRYVPSVLTMSDLATLFSEFVDRPVVDRTGLSGHFYAALEGAEIRPPGPFDAGYRPADATREMFTSMPKELGLRLEPTTGPVEVLVIEDVTNPNKPDLPLVVERAEVGPGRAARDQISVSVHNTGDKTIVAWGVASQITFADGKTSGGGSASDGVEYRGLDRRGSRVLTPGARHTITFGGLPNRRQATDVRTVTAKAEFVILDDDTALGDENTIVRYFRRRAENQRAWPTIEKAFTDAMAQSSDPRQQLIDARTNLEAIAEDVRTTEAYTSIHRDLTVNSRIAPDPAGLLKRLVDEARSRRAAADAHYQRRR
jgi:uncharacterized protein (TIGR03435 family)